MFVIAANFDAALDVIARLNMINLVKAKYGQHLKKREALADTGNKLKERLAREPLGFVPQAEFGRGVLPEKIHLELVDSNTLFRNWMKVFSNEGLIEQIKVGGCFQFRATLKTDG
jgi:hypothetical protein